MSTSKIKIKLGAIEVEYEGSETFLKEELPQLLAAVSDLYSKSKGALDYTAAEPVTVATASQASATQKKIEATTGALAGKLNVKSGPDLVLAAAARLTFVLGSATFSRQKLIDEMKTAAAYYKASYLSNLTQLLNSLVKEGKLNEPSQGNYALTAPSLKDLEQRIV
jgi:hypothetical protein